MPNQKFEHRLHIITVDHNGEPRNADESASQCEGEEFNEQLSDIQASIKASGNKEVVIYVHGGLNRFKASFRSAEEICQSILVDGKYPIFIRWQSGLISTYLEHIFLIRQGRRANILGPCTSLFVFSSDILRAVSRALISATKVGTLSDPPTGVINHWSFKPDSPRD